VSHSVFDSWVELPLISPDHVTVARKIKYIFSGDLEKRVRTYPKFNG